MIVHSDQYVAKMISRMNQLAYFLVNISPRVSYYTSLKNIYISCASVFKLKSVVLYLKCNIAHPFIMKP
jgi:hypothetical protein